MVNGLYFIAAYFKLEALDKRVVDTTKRGYQPGSAKNLRTYINRYLDFCIEFKLPPVPANGQQLRRFAQFLADSPSISGIETINNYLWGLRMFHRMLNLPPPDMSEFLINLTLCGLKLTLAQQIRQAEPMTPELLEKMFLHINLQSEEQLTAWTALVVGFHLLLRKSNLVPDTQGTFDPEKQIARRNLCLAKNVILVEIHWCKTLQFKEKVLVLLLIQLKDSIICPVFWIWSLIKRIPAKSNSPLFCYHRNNKYMVMTYPRLTYWFRHWLDQCNVNSKAFTLHSCHRGGATFLHKADI